MGTVNVQIIGLDNVMNALARLGEQTLDAVGAAVQAEAEYELSLTQEQVPVRTEQLKFSGRVEPADEGMVIANVIAYGGPAGSGGPKQTVDVDYALIVHEDLEVHHRNGKAKYVEDPVRAEMESGRAVARMAADIARVMQYPGGATGRARLTGAGKFASRGGTWLRGSGGRFLGSSGIQG